MHYKYIYRFPRSNEIELKWVGNCGAKGEKRAPKKKKTKEEIARINQINKENMTRRIIKLNFDTDDLWCCCKYPARYRPKIEEVRKDRKEWLREVRKQYLKHGAALKFVSRLEVGACGGIHFHILVNRIWNAQTDVILSRAWDKQLKKSYIRRGQPPPEGAGYIDYTPVYDAGGYQGLAEYIAKKPKEDSEEYEQLQLFEKSEQKKLLTVSTSRNLKRPVPEKKKYSMLTVRKILEDGPIPTKGYYIVPDSIVKGVNPFTGYSYLKYTEELLAKKTRCHGEVRDGCGG